MAHPVSSGSPFRVFAQSGLTPGFRTELPTAAAGQLIVVTQLTVVAELQAPNVDSGNCGLQWGDVGYAVSLSPVNLYETQQWQGQLPIGGGPTLFIAVGGDVGVVRYTATVIGHFEPLFSG